MTVNQEINNRNSELFIGDFNRIVDYLVLLILIYGNFSYTKAELKKIVNNFEYHAEGLRNFLSTPPYHKVIGTDVKRKISDIRNFTNNLDVVSKINSGAYLWNSFEVNCCDGLLFFM